MARCGCNCRSSNSDTAMAYIVKESKGDQEVGHVLLLKQAIVEGVGTLRLAGFLDKCQRDSVQDWRDDKGYDLMHYAILSNNQEAVLLLFTKQYFLKPHEPDVPYLHLACEVGFRTISGFILEYRPTEDVPLIYEHGDFPIAPKVVGGNKKDFFTKDKAKKHRKAIFHRPVDVAAYMGHIHCVRALLDRFYRGSNCLKSDDNLGHLAIATKIGSPIAVKFLLDNPTHTVKDVLRAIDMAIREIQPKCLDLLLRENSETSSLYSGMNLYHVLYQYPLAFDQDRLASYPEATEVLIKHGYDANACCPGRTFPLYSLLGRRAFYNASYQVLEPCLLSLLEIGADPNHDENEQELKGSEGAIGRKAYPSGIFCLLHTAYSVAKSLEVTDPALQVIKATVYRCLYLLLKYKANARKIAKVYHLYGRSSVSHMTVLHEYMRCASALSIHPMALALLLKYGANPMAKFKDMLPLTTYCLGRHKLCLERETEPLLLSRSDSSMLWVTTICDHLDFKDVRSYRENLAKTLPAADNSRAVQESLSKYLCTVRSLKQECCSRIWQCCGRDMHRLQQLSLPQQLESDVYPQHTY